MFSSQVQNVIHFGECGSYIKTHGIRARVEVRPETGEGYCFFQLHVSVGSKILRKRGSKKESHTKI